MSIKGYEELDRFDSDQISAFKTIIDKDFIVSKIDDAARPGKYQWPFKLKLPEDLKPSFLWID